MIDLYSNFSKGALHPSQTAELLRRSLSATTPKTQTIQAFRLDRRLGRSKMESLIKRYGAGEPMSFLAMECGVSKSGMHDLLTRHGVTTRYRGMSSSEIEEAAARYNAGASLSPIAVEFPASQETIQKMLIRTGTSRRPARRQ